MFTGIIETTAPVLRRSETALILARPEEFPELVRGQSIAINGACLSVTEVTPETVSFDVVPETFARTNLREAEVVNLERALPAQGRFEGHVVLGHVDATLRLLRREKEGEGERCTFEFPKALRHLVVEKGSVTLNGVALTVAGMTDEEFSVAVIPHTLETTNLAILKPGEAVNVEADIMAKYWHKWFQERKLA